MNTLFYDFIYLFSWLIKKINPKVYIYVKVYRNKIEMLDVSSGKSIIRISEIGFSSNRLLIADHTEIEKLGKEMINKLCGQQKYTRSIL